VWDLRPSSKKSQKSILRCMQQLLQFCRRCCNFEGSRRPAARDKKSSFCNFACQLLHADSQRPAPRDKESYCCNFACQLLQFYIQPKDLQPKTKKAVAATLQTARAWNRRQGKQRLQHCRQLVVCKLEPGRTDTAGGAVDSHPLFASHKPQADLMWA